MDEKRLEEILRSIPSLRVGLIGDGCVDIYWDVDMRLSELSRETPQFPLPVVGERFSLGAGANVLANLAALGARNIRYIGCIGTDWRGEIFKRLLHTIGVSPQWLAESPELVTAAYCKPMLHGISPVVVEAPRVDFLNRRPLPRELEEKVLRSLRELAGEIDVLVVCDQFANGCITERVIDEINRLGETIPVVADSRDRIGRYRNAVIKPNEAEACACLGRSERSIANPHEAAALARELAQRGARSVLLTIGSQGSLWLDGGRCTHMPAVPAEPPVDFVGAGDSFLSGFALAAAGKLPPGEALLFATLVPAVTVKKLGTTGTASPDEIRAAFSLAKSFGIEAKQL